MEYEEMFSRVEGIFRDIFDDEQLAIARETVADDIEDWDSLNHINLVTALESEFAIRFALGELQGLKNVGDMLDLVQQKISA
ncbi:MAG: acyl carrier protein [Verrucomicrobiota bacterium]|jgi:acyl carrier protein